MLGADVGLLPEKLGANVGLKPEDEPVPAPHNHEELCVLTSLLIA